MYHWDLPQYIQDLGGFTNPLLVDYFEHFADVLFKHYGDRVKKWITFNEPFNFCLDGYSNGRMAPGVKAPGVGEYLCTHHMLQAHASAYHLYKRKYFDKQQGQIGISLNSRFHYPKDDSVDPGLTERAQDFRVSVMKIIKSMNSLSFCFLAWMVREPNFFKRRRLSSSHD
jgi:beta-glucosidase/6-phospho-beta-glucosidase/beta-galactosidase